MPKNINKKIVKAPVYLQYFRLRFKHQHPLGSQCIWEGALSRSGCLKALPKRKKRGQNRIGTGGEKRTKGDGAGEDTGLALFSFTAAVTSSV